MSDRPESIREEPEESFHSPRVDGLAGLAITPERAAERRLAGALREIIDLLATASADVDQLVRASEAAESFAELLRLLPSGVTYRGFAEAANAGGEVDGSRLDDEYWFAVFDHSPFIGLANPLSPPMMMAYEQDLVRATVTFSSAYEGPPGCVHGGYIAGVFDELLGAAQSLSGSQGMTAHLDVDYRSPTPLHQELEMIGRFERRDGRKIHTTGEIRHNGRVTAEAHGLFIAIDAGMFNDLLTSRDSSSG